MVVHISRKPSNIYIYLQVVYFLSIVHLQIFLLTSNSLCYSCFSNVQEGKDVFLRHCKILFATARRRCVSSRTSSEMELLGVRETSAGTPRCKGRNKTCRSSMWFEKTDSTRCPNCEKQPFPVWWYAQWKEVWDSIWEVQL
jgi:hypothetical protein